MRSVCFIIIFLVFFLNVKCQNWTAPGAQWTYSFNELFSYGYVSIEHTGDTLINGKLCDVLEKIKYGYSSPGYYDTIALGHEYTYLDSGRVWVYRDYQFWILYDFNAPVGSSWACKGNNNFCPQQGEFHVDSTGIMVINSDTLKVVHTSPMPGSGWHYIGPIIEKIGCLGYMFPEPVCIFDSEEGGPFRCYSDNNGWTYESGISMTCNYINSINSLDRNANFQIHPNPVYSGFSIKQIKRHGFEPIVMSIYNFQGKLLDEIILEKDNYYYNAFNLTAGIYSVLFQNGFEKNNILMIINK